MGLFRYKTCKGYRQCISGAATCWDSLVHVHNQALLSAQRVPSTALDADPVALSRAFLGKFQKGRYEVLSIELNAGWVQE